MSLVQVTTVNTLRPLLGVDETLVLGVDDSDDLTGTTDEDVRLERAHSDGVVGLAVSILKRLAKTTRYMSKNGATVVEILAGIADARVHRAGNVAVLVQRVPLPGEDGIQEFPLAGAVDRSDGEHEVNGYHLGS